LNQIIARLGHILIAVWLVALVCLSGHLPAWASSSPSSSDSKVLLRAGVAAFQVEDYRLAIEQFTKSLEAGFSAAAYGNRCLAHLHLEEYTAAIADCTAALQLNAKEPESYLNRGLAYYRTGNFTAAIADYSQLLQIKPHDFRAYYNRGLAEAEQQAYREAIVDYGEAMRQVSPLDRATLAEIHNDRGLSQLWLEQWPQAIAEFTQAIQFSHADLRAYYNRGCAYHHQGNLVASLSDFTQVLQLTPNHAQAYLSRGLVQQQLGQSEAALADLQQAAQYFRTQGARVAYQQTLDLIEKLRVSGVAVG
jgi:tetratricopeptide (TPR) repeat protein